MPLAPVPFISEIRLHRARPSSGLRRLAACAAPYWAYPWPGGIALARHILDRPDIAAGRRVLDLGAGGGLVAIAAAKAGAREVVAAEIDPHAAFALRLNAAANAVVISIAAADLTVGAPPAVDLILVGDLFYASGLAKRVTGFLDRCRDAGLDVLIGDIGRDFLPMSRLRRIAAYPVTEVGQPLDGAPMSGGVFVIEKSA